MKTNTTYAALKAGAGALAVGLALAYSTSAFAQDTTPPADDAADEGEAIVVTGTLLRSTANDTPSPVTVLSSETLDQRGIQTTQEAIQRIASNNGPAITQSFTANGAFAAGASAVSLRGLSTNSTLVLFNGMRAAYYPLSDDATRNFVDLNTIPDDIVDRIEVLRDGASSLYGADAIAGVVNVITKKQITGLSGRAEAGITQRGDASTYRLGLTGGFGDLSSDGYNVYASGFYYKQNALYNSDLPYPYNSQDQSGICRNGICGPQVGPNSGSINPSSQGYAGWGDTALSPDRRLLATTFFVAPSDGSIVANPLGRYQFLNPTAGCIAGETPYNLTAAELGQTTNQFAPNTVCQGDLVNQYGVVSPTVERFGGSARATKRFGDVEAFIEGNFIQSKVFYSGEPATIRGNANAGLSFPRFSTYTGGPPNAPGSFALQLPVFVCPLVNGLPQPVCNAGNGQLNPNNPFAASGQTALLLGRIPNLIEYNETLSKTYRIAGGFSGPINDDWEFNVNAVGMWNTVDRTSSGYVYIQRLLNVIADGSYNFVDPLSNSQTTLDYLSPDNVTRSTSKLWSAEAFVRGKLMDLPGGPLQLAVGSQIRYESIKAPSANDDFAGPTERYFVLNAFGTNGSRHVYSIFGEVGAPVLDWAEVNVSGRWDKYSSGQKAFSPKAGVQFKPIDGLTIRGTWSRGFRIPSFGEANALPTTGFVVNTKGVFNDTYLAQYGCSVATFNSCPPYIRSGSYGQTTLATPDLKPERSTSWTAGIIYQPMRNVQLSFDYYRIKKTGAITTSPFSQGLSAYYSGAPIPAEFNIIPDAPDQSNPTAQPRVAFIQTNFINANTIRSEGLDFAANARFRITDDITWTTNLEASYILKLETEFPDGTVERYDGTLGNFALTAGSGTPKWRGTWQNTLGFGELSLTGTVNYFGGYNLSAMDSGTERGDCGLLSAEFVKCDVPAYITVDLHTAYKVTDKFTFYVDVQNLFDDLPPIDPITYGANNYNPVQGGTGIFGRTIRAGVKFGF